MGNVRIAAYLFLLGWAFLLTSMTASAQLVNYWPLDGDLSDAAKFGEAVDIGKAIGVETYVEGKLGQALDLDGSSHVLFSPSEDLALNGDVSVAMWFRVDSWNKAEQTLFAGGPKKHFRLQRYEETDHLAFRLGNEVIIAEDVADGEWHHLVAVSQTEWGTRLYLDGRMVGLADRPSLTASTGVMLGANPSRDGLDWKGQIDEVGVFHKALNDYEVTMIFALAGDPRFRCSLAQSTALLEAHEKQQDVMIAGGRWTFVEWADRGGLLAFRLDNDRSGMQLNRRPHIDTFVASEVFPELGQEITLSWTSLNATSLTLYPGGIDLSDHLPSGSVKVSPDRVTLYNLMAESEEDGADLKQLEVYAGRAIPRLQLSEWMADPGGEMPDEAGEKPDWIEVRNPGPLPISTAGYYLTDDPEDPRRWPLPKSQLEPGSCQIIFASGAASSSRPWHASFKLDQEGEDLALTFVDADNADILCGSVTYPRQRRGISYGKSSADMGHGYLAKPTPGSINDGEPLKGLARSVYFSVKRGLKTESFALELDCSTPGAQIRFTRDGSLPTSDGGTIYEGPIKIATTSVVRAVAFADDHVPSLVTSHSYVYPEDIVSQGVLPEGWPKSWGGEDGDYEVDPEVTETSDFVEGFRSLPVVSIMADQESLFGKEGIYSNSENSGRAWERSCSVEMLFPSGRSFQVDSGLRMHGGYGRKSQFLKHSFRLLFKRDHGPSRLKEKVFPEDDGVTESFDTLILRSGFNNTWHRDRFQEASSAQYLRDEFARRTQRAMGHASAHGSHVHVMLNGLYWGLYNLVERPSAAFAATYLGGEKEEWDASNSGKIIDGKPDAFESILKMMNVGMIDKEAYEGLRSWVDMRNLIDYLILNFYVGNEDWDHHNWYAAVKRKPREGLKFFSWDAEMSLAHLRVDRVSTDGNSSDDSILRPTALHALLVTQEEYRMAFADRVHKLLNGDGILSPDKCAERYRRLADRIELGVVCESARWGDAFVAEPYTVEDWRVERDRLLEHYFPRRTAIVLKQFVRHGLYPSITPPMLQAVDGGSVTLSAKEGEIWYTMDGQDPRLGGGAIRPEAKTGEALLLKPEQTLKARAYQDGTWSALSEYSFGE